jgi:undecaprenyl diphosphate synthase
MENLGPAPPPPAHVAIIMDGNGRWAKGRSLPRIAGHRRGAEAVRRTVEAAGELGIAYLTLFGFSSENWKRPTSST